MLINLNGSYNIPTKEECLELSKKDIVGCTLFFNKLQDILINEFLRYDSFNEKSKPGGGVLGVVESFLCAFETNARGRFVFIYKHIILQNN